MPWPVAAQGWGQGIYGGRGCIYLIYFCFPGTQQRVWHTEGIQKHWLLNSIITIMGNIISAHSLTITQTEARRA